MRTEAEVRTEHALYAIRFGEYQSGVRLAFVSKRILRWKGHHWCSQAISGLPFLWLRSHLFVCPQPLPESPPLPLPLLFTFYFVSRTKVRAFSALSEHSITVANGCLGSDLSQSSLRSVLCPTIHSQHNRLDKSSSLQVEHLIAVRIRVSKPVHNHQKYVFV